uniref:Uncharacterized protein n=1 Tax=Peronospora matthiolae TaxID=2874970 RepID=A0AAV1TYP3_9STRA
MDTPEHLQRVAIKGYVDRELADLRRRASTSTVVKTSKVVKLDVSSYSGVEAPRFQSLAL